jgi:hypothetical protein
LKPECTDDGDWRPKSCCKKTGLVGLGSRVTVKPTEAVLIAIKMPPVQGFQST